MIQLKPGVRIHTLSPQAVLGMIVVASVFSEWDQDLTVTSVCEGKHSDKSKHYIGHAFDVRTPNDRVHWEEMLTQCRTALLTDWDVIDEDDHWHFEWDPKGKPI